MNLVIAGKNRTKLRNLPNPIISNYPENIVRKSSKDGAILGVKNETISANKFDNMQPSLRKVLNPNRDVFINLILEKPLA